MEIRKFVFYLNIFFLIVPLIRGAGLTSSAISLDNPDSELATSNNERNFTDADANISVSISANMTKNETVNYSNKNISDSETISISDDDSKSYISNVTRLIIEGDRDIVKEDILNREEKDELDDLQHGGNFENITKTIDENDLVDLPDTIDSGEVLPRETEWIEEDKKENDVDIPPFVQAMTDNSAEKVQYLFQGQTGLIIAALLIILFAGGYIGFIAWRQFIEKRYGNRERLINEDDMIDPNDMKHFSI